MDCRREGKAVERGRQGSSRIEGKIEERFRVRQWAYKMRREDTSRPGGEDEVVNRDRELMR